MTSSSCGRLYWLVLRPLLAPVSRLLLLFPRRLGKTVGAGKGDVVLALSITRAHLSALNLVSVGACPILCIFAAGKGSVWEIVRKVSGSYLGR